MRDGNELRLILGQLSAAEVRREPAMREGVPYDSPKRTLSQPLVGCGVADPVRVALHKRRGLDGQGTDESREDKCFGVRHHFVREIVRACVCKDLVVDAVKRPNEARLFIPTSSSVAFDTEASVP